MLPQLVKLLEQETLGAINRLMLIAAANTA